MIDYATVAQEILETPPRQPDWVRERIGESDELRDRLEEINLREANEIDAVKQRNRDDYPNEPQPIPESQRVSSLLRLRVGHLVEQVSDFVENEMVTLHELDRELPTRAIPLLELVFDVQEVLFELGLYRQLLVREEEEESQP